jgi:peptidoglycan hydrolase CwlO-like protein
MAKPTKVKYDESDDKYESDDFRSDDDEKEYSKKELMDMLEQVHTCLEMKRKECKDLCKKVKSLEQFFVVLQASHESLKEDHEELGNAHTRIEKAHSSLIEQAKEEANVTCDKGSTCDLINESFFEPIIVSSTNPSFSTPLLSHLLLMVSLMMPH